MSPRVLHWLAQDHLEWRGVGAALLVLGGVAVLVLGIISAAVHFARRGFRWPRGDRGKGRA